MNSQRNDDLVKTTQRTRDDIAGIREKVRRAGDNFMAEHSQDFYKCLRAGVQAVVYSFKKWAERSLS